MQSVSGKSKLIKAFKREGGVYMLLAGWQLGMKESGWKKEEYFIFHCSTRAACGGVG
jgi:hypothetical protein